MLKFLLIPVALVSLLSAETPWIENKCMTCHGIKGDTPVGPREISLSDNTSQELNKKIIGVRFLVSYNDTKRSVSKIEGHKILIKANSLDMESMGQEIGKNKRKKSIDAKKTTNLKYKGWKQ